MEIKTINIDTTTESKLSLVNVVTTNDLQDTLDEYNQYYSDIIKKIAIDKKIQKRYNWINKGRK